MATANQTKYTAKSVKAQISELIGKAMKAKGLSQTDLAKAMNTSRAVVHRMLDPEDTSITLHTLSGAVTALGSRIRVQILPVLLRPVGGIKTKT